MTLVNIYSKGRPFKERMQNPAKMKRFVKKQEENDIVQHVVDEIILK